MLYGKRQPPAEKPVRYAQTTDHHDSMNPQVVKAESLWTVSAAASLQRTADKLMNKSSKDE